MLFFKDHFHTKLKDCRMISDQEKQDSKVSKKCTSGMEFF